MNEIITPHDIGDCYYAIVGQGDALVAKKSTTGDSYDTRDDVVESIEIDKNGTISYHLSSGMTVTDEVLEKNTWFWFRGRC